MPQGKLFACSLSISFQLFAEHPVNDRRKRVKLVTGISADSVNHPDLRASVGFFKFERQHADHCHILQRPESALHSQHRTGLRQNYLRVHYRIAIPRFAETSARLQLQTHVFLHCPTRCDWSSTIAKAYPAGGNLPAYQAGLSLHVRE